MDAERLIRADELTRDDLRRFVRFKRFGSEVGPPEIRGWLMAVERATYTRGNIARLGYVLTLGSRRSSGRLDTAAYGPVPANYPVHVGSMKRAESRDPDDGAPDSYWRAWGRTQLPRSTA